MRAATRFENALPLTMQARNFQLPSNDGEAGTHVLAVKGVAPREFQVRSSFVFIRTLFLSKRE